MTTWAPLPLDRILHADVLDGLRSLPDESVHCVVTSPPYWALRDYGVAGQIGLEPTPAAYLERMVEVFAEVLRVLRRDGTCWLNIGDSYASPPGSKGGQGQTGAIADRSAVPARQAAVTARNRDIRPGSPKHAAGAMGPMTQPGLKPKDLCGIPWRLALALQASGWWLRSDIIWAKPNPMPESVTDRPTKSHEYLFLLTKAERYFYDAAAIAEPVTASTTSRLAQDIASQAGSLRVPGKSNGPMKAVVSRSGNKERKPGCDFIPGASHVGRGFPWEGAVRNSRSVWSIPTESTSEAHFATFPQALVTRCIKAGCPAVGVVLDPFMGSGTVALVAKKLGRHFIGVELNADYIRIAEKRLQPVGLLMEASA